MKTNIILFSEVPTAGKTKLGITTDRGGILSYEQAADFYRNSLIDTLNVCADTVADTIYVCCNNDGDLDEMQRLIDLTKGKNKTKIITDQGGGFGKCVDFAINELKDQSDILVLLSGDIPDVQPYQINDIIAKTANNEGITVSVCPSQSGAPSVIAMDSNAEISFSNIFDHENEKRSLEGLVDEVYRLQYPFFMGETVADVDDYIDMASMIALLNSLQIAAKYDNTLVIPVNTINYFVDLGLQAIAPSAPTDDCLGGCNN